MRPHLEEGDEVALVGGREARRHAHVEQHQLCLWRASRHGVQLDEDVAGVEVGVDEVVTEEHLEVALRAQVGYALVVHALLAHVAADQLPLLERLDQHVGGDERRRCGAREVNSAPVLQRSRGRVRVRAT
jgi:hypothetical protein